MAKSRLSCKKLEPVSGTGKSSSSVSCESVGSIIGPFCLGKSTLKPLNRLGNWLARKGLPDEEIGRPGSCVCLSFGDTSGGGISGPLKGVNARLLP